MNAVYNFILSGITINNNPIIGMLLICVIDLIAYKIAFRFASNSFDHWGLRLILLV